MHLAGTMTVTAVNVCDDLPPSEQADWRGAPPEVHFTARVDDYTMLEFRPENGASPEDWTRLAVACETGDVAELDWAPSNGLMLIKVSGRVASFVTARYGDGRGGSSETHLPALACNSAFREAAAITARWLGGE